MTPVVACVNLKGGVGKTALAVNFAAYCGRKKRKTLLVDLDPQTNATFSSIGVEKWQAHTAKHGTVADLLGARRNTSAEGKKRPISDIVIKDVFKNVDLIPSHLELFTIDLDLAGATARETRLRRALEKIKEEYDIVVCDCPPNLTIPTQNALAFSSHYVVPVSPDFLSALGIALLINRVKIFSNELEHDIQHAGIVLSRIGRPATHRAETISTIEAQFGDLVFDARIKERASVSAAAEANEPIYKSTDQTAADEFRAVSEELLNRIGVK